MNKELIERLASESGNPCVTISMNTHRTHPDNANDEILLKNLSKEAESRVLEIYEKRDVSELIDKITSLQELIDVNYNLDSLHVFVSKDTLEIVRSPWATVKNIVHIGDKFALRQLIKDYSRTVPHHILALSQSGVRLYNAVNDAIVEEVKNEDFPFAESEFFQTNSEKKSDSKSGDNLVREYLNRVDKAVVKVVNASGLKCVVICTEDNYSKLMQVADKPGIYLGYSNINYNAVKEHQLAHQSWEMLKNLNQANIDQSIALMHEAVGQGKVVTDVGEIYRAAKEGRGDFLLVHNDFKQSVRMNGDDTFTVVENHDEPGVIEDITGHIAQEVLSKKGEVVFTSREDMKDLGSIILKLRY